MKTLLMLKGLPASGKSTYAKKLVEESGYVRVNKDDMRAMLHNSKWSKGNEKFVLKLRDHIVRSALEDGKHVVVDDTNFAPVHENTLRQLAKDYDAAFKVEFLDMPLDECIARDLKRPNSVGERVIRQMYDQYLKPEPATVKYDPDLPTVILCDIDGTLANMKDRSPYDWSRVGEDEVDETVKHFLQQARSAGDTIFMMSGRDGVCEPETREWLRSNGIEYTWLAMRKPGDTRKDSIIKRELYEEQIKGNFNVRLVLDDRNQVVEMWRELGLKCFQVAPGDF